MSKTTENRFIRAHYNKALFVLGRALDGVQTLIEAAEGSPEKAYLTEYLEDLDQCSATLQLMKHHLFVEREKRKDPGAESAPARPDGTFQP